HAVSGLTGNPLGWTRRRGERGAVASFVAVLLGAGVLLGVGALVVDVGQIFAEREQLQSGADSAALRVAKSCAPTETGCPGTVSATATTFAGRNAKDNASAATVCGSAFGLTACPAQHSGLSGCLGTPPALTPYAEVRTSTLTASGGTLLSPTFSRAVAGNGGSNGR